ncbi:hypothetical protein CGCVW01_v004478 [Colletotrichum viniferum]|nr:hypothetical protein CGCVW01_v004478 [Colletotrichum viniferum]
MRAEIQFGLMVSIKASVDAAATRGHQSLQKLDDAMRQIIATLSSDNDTIWSEMERRVQNLNHEVASHFERASRLASQRHDELLDAIAGSNGPAKSRVPQDPALVTERILKRLWFPRMNDRYEDILPAHEKTFEWIFSRDLRLHSSSNFIDWIENGTGIYWMSGRAGSGKSTLVKFMADHPQTEILFRTWACGQPLVTAKYLFWDLSPDNLQKSLDGLFRGILYGIIREETSFAPLLFPDQFEEENGWSGPFPTSNELKRAFKRLVSLGSSPTQVALLIDGLDEYSAPRGAQQDLAETLKRAACSKHMKIIASSRPETVFEKTFSDCNKLYLHEMTSQDQALFVSDKLYEHQRTSYLMDISDGKKSVDFLTMSAVERSEGIFLWLRLVVEALVKELDVCESIRDLNYILLQFPQGLEQLFLHMMRRMLRENERRGFECLWIMRQSLSLQYKQSPSTDLNTRRGDDSYSFSLTAFCMDGAQMPLNTVLKTKVATLSSVALKDTVTKVENRLRNWCAGLLELKPISGFTELEEPEVAFVHRSVSEFLNLPTACSDLVEELTETSFDVNFMLMKGLLIKLKREAPTWHFQATGRIWVFVELIIRLAQFANDDRRHDTHALLSELDRSMTSLFEIRQSNPAFWEMCQLHSGTNHWTSYFPWALRNGRKDFGTPCDCIQRTPCFLSIAVENGLAEFVLDSLEKPEIKSAVKAAMGAPLLNSACRPPPFSIAIPGTIRPAIIHKLLDLGADPNQVCHDGAGRQTTAWKSMLNTVNDLEIKTVEGARQYAEILKDMIKHGADQRVRMSTRIITQGDDTESRSSSEIIFSPDNFTASKTTHQNDGGWLEVCRSTPALSEVQIEHVTDVEEGSLTVKDIIHQAFTTKPSFRKISDAADLPGTFVPFEDVDSTWQIRNKDWGDQK